VLRAQLGEEGEETAALRCRGDAIGLCANVSRCVRHRDADARHADHLEVVFLVADRDGSPERDVEMAREPLDGDALGCRRREQLEIVGSAQREARRGRNESLEIVPDDGGRPGGR
jgi:hypothetical protein